MAIILILAAAPMMFFVARGAWPIVGFVGLDVVLVWWALRSAFRGGKRHEEVTLWPDELEVRLVDAKGQITLTRFNPLFVKLVVDRDINERTTGIHLRTHDEDVKIGEFLAPEEKSSFAKAFGTALRRARH
jgi:uncharacterized membrane protein